MKRNQVLDHEKMRFSTMTPQQLLTRLYRITKPDKLNGYIDTALALGYNSLAKAAIDKRNGMKVTPTNPVINLVMENKLIEKNEAVIIKDVVFRRSLDF